MGHLYTTSFVSRVLPRGKELGGLIGDQLAKDWVCYSGTFDPFWNLVCLLR
jgi:hypothetical protein